MHALSLRNIERALYVGAGLLLGFWGWTAFDGWAFQHGMSRRLEALLHGGRGAARREARQTGLVGRIVIPRLGLEAIIVEGTSYSRLRRGVGHLNGSAFPGERGNAVLAAHRDTYFRALRRIRRGDEVILTTLDGTFRYRVESTLVVPPGRTDLIARTPDARLTLVTCYPFDWIGPAPERFVVRSKPATRTAV